MAKETKDKISGIIFVIFGLVLLGFMIPYSIASIEVKYAGPKEFPTFIAICMIIGGGAVAMKAWRSESKQKTKTLQKKKPELSKDQVRMLLFVGLMFLYAISFQLFGYLFSGILMTIAILVLLEEKNKAYYLISMAAVLLLYVMFTQLLFVELP